MNISNLDNYLDIDYSNRDKGQDNNEKEQSHYAIGWVCPKCGSVYNPFISECWRCNSLINSSGIPYLPIIYG